MKSMTGYGRAVAEEGGNHVTVEVSAVNSRKQVEMRFTIPRELGMIEPSLRKIILEKLSRGTLQIVVSYKLDPEARASMSCIDHEKFAAVQKELRSLAEAAKMEPPSLQDVLMIPGVLSEGESQSYEHLQTLAMKALEEALVNLDRARLEEGMRLKEDLVRRGRLLEELVSAIAGRADEAVILQKKRLQERIATLGIELQTDDERLAKELAFYVEKADITEETVRLQSHLVQYAALLDSDDDPGRNLDFLGQEMNREANTLSAKTADMSISGYALTLKTELARIREQIMNIE